MIDILFFLFVSVGAVVDDLKFFNDRLLYSITYLSHDQLAATPSQSTWIPLKSTDEENYQCLLPEINFSGDTRIQSYSGPSPAKIIETIHKTKECALRIEPFWIYEVCAGKSVRQFHEDKTTKTILEYNLGNHQVVPWEQTTEKFDQLNPPKVEVGGVKVAYYPVLYKNGTKCDITGDPRSTTIFYVCDERSTMAILSLAEIRTCEYEIVVGTTFLCHHPSFVKPKIEQFEIKCFPATPETSIRPAAYDQFANDLDFDDFSEVLEKRAGIKRRPKGLSLEEQAAQLPNSRMSLDAVIKSALIQKKESFRALLKMVEDFFSGRRCLVGGKEGQKFEACYKKHVLHFLDDSQSGKRKKVVLGRYSEKIQRDWATANPGRIKKLDEDGMVSEVTNVFTQGELCEATGKPRIVHMKLSCLLEKNILDSLQIRTMLVEAKPCEHVLLIESGLLCSYLQKSNEFGIYKEETFLDYMPLLLDALKNVEAKEFVFIDKTFHTSGDEKEDEEAEEEERPKRTTKKEGMSEDLRHAPPFDP